MNSPESYGFISYISKKVITIFCLEWGITN